VLIELKRDSHVPLYDQIAGQVRGMITGGTLKIGDRLPANRELARILGVNRTTVTTAYAELMADGLINSHVGRGTFICALPAAERPAPGKERPRPSPIQWGALLTDQGRDTWLSGLPPSPGKGFISLAYSLPASDVFPLDEFRRAVDRVIRKEGRVLLESGATGGYDPLQEYVAAQMASSGARVGPEQILITNGCQQSLNLICQVLVGPGDEVAVENPTYPGALSVFCGNNSRHISVPVGPRGIDLDVLESVLSQRRPKLIYTIPSFQNPTGATMDMAARRRLLELAVKHRIPIIEDDIYRELRYDGPSLPSLKALDDCGLVIYVNSFSKIGFPGVRVGWIAADKSLIAHLSAAKRRSDLHTSVLAQAAIYEFSRRGLIAKHIKRLKKVHAERRDAMLAALEKYFPDESTWTRPEGGMAIWVAMPEAMDANQVLRESIEKGVVFSPGEHFYSNLAPANMARLSFSTATPAAIEEAVKRLGAILKARLVSLKKQRTGRPAEAFRALV
jgi:2-aminoadipate transaminase